MLRKYNHADPNPKVDKSKEEKHGQGETQCFSTGTGQSFTKTDNKPVIFLIDQCNKKLNMHGLIVTKLFCVCVHEYHHVTREAIVKFYSRQMEKLWSLATVYPILFFLEKHMAQQMELITMSTNLVCGFQQQQKERMDVKLDGFHTITEAGSIPRGT